MSRCTWPSAVMDSRYLKPRTPIRTPATEPRPPMTEYPKIVMLSTGGKLPGLSAWSNKTSSAPATPAMTPATAKPASLIWVVGTAAEAAARSLSLVPMRTRPARALRMPLTARMASTRNARHTRYISYSLLRSKRCNSRGLGTPSAGMNCGNVAWFKKYWSRAMASARVVTARNSPLMRSAGRPTSSATAAPTTPDTETTMKKSAFQWATMFPATTPATPAMPNWPRLIWPPQPVSTTRDTPIIAQMMAKPASSWLLGPHVWGIQMNARASTAKIARRAHFTSGSRRNSLGTAFSAPTADHDDAPASSARLSLLDWASRAMTITAR